MVTPPKRLRKVDAVYPPLAKAAELEGTVILEVEVGADGKVHKVTVKRSVRKVLADAARQAVQQWEYAPQLRNGVPEAGKVTESVQFKLP